MKSRTLQPLVIAFFVAVTIVSFNHIWELIENFSLAAFGFSGLTWFYQAAQNPPVSQAGMEEADNSRELESPKLQPNIAVIFEDAVTDEALTGTEDLWEISPASDAVATNVAQEPQEPVERKFPFDKKLQPMQWASWR